MIVELARDRVERIADRDVDIGVRGILRAIAVDDQLFARNMDVDPDLVAVAVRLMAMRSLDDDPSTRDSPGVPLQLLLRLFADSGLDGLGAIHVLEGDLERNLHAHLHPPLIVT